MLDALRCIGDVQLKSGRGVGRWEPTLFNSLTPALRREGGNIGYSIRPSARGKGFGSEILRLSLGRARELGLADVLLTCGKPNVVSAKVIKRNGGVLESEEFLPNRGEIVQRYVIQSAVNRSA